MAKKIQLSTVRQEADVEVIYVNAALICKVINAHNVMDSIIRKAKDNYGIKEPTHTVLDENGEPCLNENGYEIKERDVDENGKPVVMYSSYKIDDCELEGLAETVLPFLNELRNTLEGE
jgi:hypothetical protein